MKLIVVLKNVCNNDYNNNKYTGSRDDDSSSKKEFHSAVLFIQWNIHTKLLHKSESHVVGGPKLIKILAKMVIQS